MPQNPAVIAFAATLLALASTPANAQQATGAQPIELTAEPVYLSRANRGRTGFGKLAWRGGLELTSPDRRFGGFSGLELSADGQRMVAVSDQGWWLSVRLQYKDRHLRAVAAGAIAPILTAKARRAKKKSKRDAEALSAFDARGIDGLVLVGFERKERVELFDIGNNGFAATPINIDSPKAISKGPKNGELEAVAHAWSGPYSGWYFAISERQLDKQGNIRGWRWKGADTVNFTIARHEDYLITDMVLLPGAQEFVTLERSYSKHTPPGMALRRFRIADLKPRQAPRGQLLFAARQPVYAIDNMEGLTVHRSEDGEVRLTLISDDNYNRSAQRTLLFQFALR